MTLSQIIARSDKDKEIPLTGFWNIRIRIQNGKVSFLGKEETFKTEEPAPFIPTEGRVYPGKVTKVKDIGVSIPGGGTAQSFQDR